MFVAAVLEVLRIDFILRSGLARLLLRLLLVVVMLLVVVVVVCMVVLRLVWMRR